MSGFRLAARSSWMRLRVALGERRRVALAGAGRSSSNADAIFATRCARATFSPARRSGSSTGASRDCFWRSTYVMPLCIGRRGFGPCPYMR